MTKLKQAYAWCRDHAWLFAVTFGALLLLIITRGKKNPLDVFKKEKEIIQAKAEARKAEIKLGTEIAAKQIREQHEVAVKRLDEAQAKRAEELAKDPEALVEHLLRASR